MNPLRSVKFQLTLWYAFILTVLLSLFAFWMHGEFARTLYRDVDRSLKAEAGALEASLTPALEKIFHHRPSGEKTPRFAANSLDVPAEARQKLRETLAQWEKNEKRLHRSLLMLRFEGLDHEPLLSNLKGWEREILYPDFERDAVFLDQGESFQTIHFQKKPIRLYYRLARLRRRPVFVIQCGHGIHELKNALDRLRFVILISIPGAVAAACAAGWFLAKRSFRPMDLMIREAKQITAAYLKGRLPRTASGDELDRLAETLNEMMDRIESSTRAIQDFSSDISHELKTPLAIIRGEIDLALRRERSAEALIETLKVIGEEVNELIRLVDDLMLLVRSDARRLRIEKKKISLQTILQQVAARFQERAQAKKIVFSSEYLKDAWIEGDDVYLKRLFSNLLDNALKFTPESGRVSVKLDCSNRAARVEISDSGVGIEPELQSKVFARFYRADGARSYEGVGLGLNIAKAICDAHGAAIQLLSRPGQGTRVLLQFPAVSSPIDLSLFM